MRGGRPSITAPGQVSYGKAALSVAELFWAVVLVRLHCT